MDASGITAIFLGDSGDPSRHTSFDSKSMLRAPRVEATLRFICFTCRSTPLRKSGSRYFNDLDQASDFGGYAIEVAMTMAASTSAAVTGHTPTQTQLDAVRERTAPPIRQALLMSWVAIYHRVSDADLERYVALWESEPIRQFEEILRVWC